MCFLMMWLLGLLGGYYCDSTLWSTLCALGYCCAMAPLIPEAFKSNYYLSLDRFCSYLSCVMSSPLILLHDASSLWNADVFSRFLPKVWPDGSAVPWKAATTCPSQGSPGGRSTLCDQISSYKSPHSPTLALVRLCSNNRWPPYRSSHSTWATFALVKTDVSCQDQVNQYLVKSSVLI